MRESNGLEIRHESSGLLEIRVWFLHVFLMLQVFLFAGTLVGRSLIGYFYQAFVSCVTGPCSSPSPALGLVSKRLRCCG